MRTVYAYLMTSLDGYHADADGSVDWLQEDPALEDYSQGQGEHIDTIVMGRRTFELMASYWPTPEAYSDDPVVAAFMNDLPKIVASRSMTTHPWGPTTFVADDVAGHLAALKDKPGKDVAIFGSSTFLASLLPTGVVDELRIAVQPVLLGAGRPLLGGVAGPVPLGRPEVRELSSGTLLLTYRPTGRA